MLESKFKFFFSKPARRCAFNILALVAVALAGTGCTIMAPQYSASPENVQTLRDGGAYSVKVKSFDSQSGKQNENPLSIRGSSMQSLYSGSYAAYLSEALREELALAKKLSPSSDTAITGTIMTNTIDASGFNVGTIDIAVRFAVTRGTQTRYEQVKNVHHEFPSSFAGAIAIPRAVQEYQFAVQKLLAALYSDKSFITAIQP